MESSSFADCASIDNNLLLAGALPAALMALLADFSLGLLEKHFSVEAKSDRKRERRPLFGIITAAALVVALLAVLLSGAARVRVRGQPGDLLA